MTILWLIWLIVTNIDTTVNIVNSLERSATFISFALFKINSKLKICANLFLDTGLLNIPPTRYIERLTVHCCSAAKFNRTNVKILKSLFAESSSVLLSKVLLTLSTTAGIRSRQETLYGILNAGNVSANEEVEWGRLKEYLQRSLAVLDLRS